jgi:hypothetical protein
MYYLHSALRLRYIDLVVSIDDARGHHFQHLSYVHSNFLDALYIDNFILAFFISNF